MSITNIELDRAHVDATTQAIITGESTVLDRLTAIISPYLETRDGQLFANIPIGKKKRSYSVKPRRGANDGLQAWAIGEYVKRYKNDKAPLIRQYKQVRETLLLEADLPEKEDSQDAQEKRGRGRPGAKLSEEDRTALFIIQTFNDWQEDGPYPGSLFVRVPPITDTRGLDLGEPAFLSKRYTGIWYLPGQEKPPTQLIDAALYYTDVTYPHASAKNKPYTGVLKAVNGRGQVKTFPFTGNELRDRENNKFKSFAKWPQGVPAQARLLDAMDALLKSDPAIVLHEQVDSLGYAETEKYGLVFALTNGIETARGFIPNEQAPVIGPDLISPGNGYQGTNEKIKATEDVWRLIFEDIEEEDAGRIAAKMGALMYTWFPPGTTENAGRLPFHIDTVGASSCGKTPEDNILKSLQGAGFQYSSPPFLTNDDTKASSPARMQIMKYLAYSDDDLKSSPGAPGFQGEHAARKRHITYYADGQGAGSRYYDHATRIASRGEPQGMPLGTSNYDHATYALTTPGLDEDPVEFRACTFVVKPGHEIRPEENSRAVFKRRQEIYAMGRAARVWLMREYNRDPGALRNYLQDLSARALATMRELFPYEWYESKQENHCMILIWGVLAWLDFLAKYGPGREQGYLYQKLSYLLPIIVEDRAIRADHLYQMIQKRDSGADIGEFVLDAIRVTLANRRAYIVAQNGEPLSKEDIPPDYGLSAFGYFQHTTMGESTPAGAPDYVWDHAHTPLGHYMKRSHTVAFAMNELYAGALVPYAREQKRDLPRIDEIKKQLLETGVLAEKQEWIKGRNKRYIVIPLESLDLPGHTVIDEEEEEEKRELMAEVDKVVSLEQARADRAGSPAPALPAQGKQAIHGNASAGAPAILPGVELLPADENDPFSFDPYA